MKLEVLAALSEGRKAIPVTFLGKEDAIEFLHVTLSLLLPNFTEETAEQLAPYWQEMAEKLLPRRSIEIESVLPELQRLIISDAQAILNGDPAAKTLEEVVLCYPGFWAAAVYRVAHAMFDRGEVLIARVLSEYAHQMTGIDIHPGADIGEGLCIDHGTGLVIGETAILGKGVKLYQGVTLGALSVKKTLAAKKRHPTLGDNVVIYANATLLGPITVGARSIIGGNVWLTDSVGEDSKIKIEQS